MKFDGVSDSQEGELADPKGYGRIEYAYHLMARAAGIQMADCRLHHENGRSHFMTRRFDRTLEGGKIHKQIERAHRGGASLDMRKFSPSRKGS